MFRMTNETGVRRPKSRTDFRFSSLIHKTHTSYYDNKEDNYAASQYIEAVSSNSLQELDSSPLS